MMAGKKPMMRENISTRLTDKYGNRATDADLGVSRIGGRKNLPANPSKPAVKQNLPANPSKPAVKQNLLVKIPKPVQKPVQVTRMVTNMKSSPTTKRR